MKFLEKDLEEIIFTSDKEFLRKRGLSLPKTLKRQLKIGNYGIADLVGIQISKYLEHNEATITVYELKQDKISVSAFLQAVGYAKGIIHYLQKTNKLQNISIKYEICLIGRNIDTFSNFIFLPDLVCSEQFCLRCITYSYELDGISFKDHYNFSLTQPGF